MKDANPEAVELVETLRRLRAARGNPTLENISRHMGGEVSVATLSRLFAGRGMPSRWAVTATARVLLRMDKRSGSGHEPGLGEVEELYDRAKAAQRQQSPGRPGGSGWPGRGLPGRPPKMGGTHLQEWLWHLIRMEGLTLRELARHTGFARSTLSDALSGTRLPSAELVFGIAQVCRVDPTPLMRVLRDLEQARQAERETAEARTDPAPPAPAPTPTPGLPQGLAESSLVDVFVRAAVSRPPAEIADLVAGLQVLGDGEFAERIVQLAVGTRSVEDVTALALALFAADPTARPGIPAQNPHPPTGSSTLPGPQPRTMPD